MKVRQEKIAALAELERLAWVYEPVGDDEVKVKCPAHEDDRPSAVLNTRKNLWNCKACKARGDFVTFLALATGVKRETILVELSTRYELEDVKHINPESVEEMHSKIWDSGPLLTALRDRGLTDEMIRGERIGYHNGRVTIPIRDAQRRIVNVRRYLPGAPSDKKVLNTSGYGKARLAGVEDLDKFEDVWVCGGECKRIVVKYLLGNVAAVCGTAGEGTWDHEWSKLLRNKRVWVCMDVDEPGRRAARDVAESVAVHALEVRIVTLPLDPIKYPNGDVNDLVGQEGAGRDELLELAQNAPVFEPGELEPGGDCGLRTLSLEQAVAPDNVGWRLEFDGVVSARDTTPYLVPRAVDVSCTRDQPKCVKCPIKRVEPDPATGFVRRTISSTSGAVLAMVGSGEETMPTSIRKALNIPKCATVEFNVRERYHVRDVRLAPIMQDAGSVQQPAFCVNVDPDLNAPYTFKGQLHPSPKSAKATLLVDGARETVDSLSTFAPGDSEMGVLEVFQPEEWTLASLETKIAELYDDLSGNVTRIYGRPELHLAIDLSYHSPLYLSIGDRKINGWTNILVMGDSAQGKSEATTKLIAHYGLGERVDCKSATRAGLIGGLQQLGTRWFVSWGVIPVHDRRLVILEEVKGTSTENIGKMTDMRSSGMAEIPMIERQRALARTRLLFVSNPRSARPLSAYSFGVEAVLELVGSLEDVRRFDLAVLLCAGQADETKRPNVEHVYTGDLCRRLVMWAWTRTREQVEFDQDALLLLRGEANRLSQEYSENVPLVDSGTTDQKLARLSAALAARTYSNDGDSIRVRRCHVEFIVAFVRRTYEAPSFGYADFSRAQRHMSTLAEPKLVVKFLLSCKYPRQLIEGLLYADEVTSVDVQDWLEADRDAAQSVVSYLVRKRALRRKSRFGYAKTPEFIGLLKRLAATAPEGTEYEEDM